MLEIVYKNPSDLIPYVNNAKVHEPEQISQISASIKEFGFNNPILLDGDNGVIAGHGRLAAAAKIGLDSVPTIELSHLSKNQKKAYVLADNRLSEVNTSWDLDLLSLELETLEAEGENIELTGFDSSFIIKQIEEGLTDEDEVPDVPEEPATVLGDIWLMGEHRLMCGDSTSIDDMDLLMAGAKADMLFTDPPYGVSYEGGHNKKKRQQIIADSLEGQDLTDLFHGAITSALINTKDGAAFYIWFASGKSIETFASLSKLPLKIRAVIQWYKVKSGLGAFMSQYIPNCEPCMYLHKEGCSPAWYGPSDEKTVWEQKKEPKNNFHPTQKPVELPARAIRNSSKQGDIILDLFGGSGSLLIACQAESRIAMVMELDPKYCDVIVTRWQNFTGKQATLEGDGRTFDELKIERI